MHTIMILPLKLAILLTAYSDQISVAALPVPTSRVTSSTISIFTGYAKANGQALSTPIANTSQPVLAQGKVSDSIRGLETRSEPDQSEQSSQRQQPADPAPCTTSMGKLGPTDEIGGTVDATKSTIASSQMNGALKLDTTTIGAETITTRETSSPFVVATTPTPDSLSGLLSILSKLAAEPTRTVTITTTSTVGAGGEGQLSVSIAGNDASSFVDTTPSTLSSPTATATTKTRSMRPAQMECPDETATGPKADYHREHSGGKQESGDGSGGQSGPSPPKNPYWQSPGPTEKGGGSGGSSSDGTSGSTWWNMIPCPPPLIQWPICVTAMLWGIYALVKKVFGCALRHLGYGHNSRKWHLLERWVNSRKRGGQSLKAFEVTVRKKYLKIY